MNRTWNLTPLKDKIAAGDQYVTRNIEGSLVNGGKGLKLSPFPSAMIGQPVPEGWIALRPMRNKARRRRGFMKRIMESVKRGW